MTTASVAGYVKHHLQRRKTVWFIVLLFVFEILTSIQGSFDSSSANITPGGASSQRSLDLSTANTTEGASSQPSFEQYSGNLTADVSSQQSIIETPKKEFTNFYSHIPKTGGYYFLKQTELLLRQSPQFKSLPRRERFHVCNMGLERTETFHKGYLASKDAGRCTMWMSEAPWTSAAKNVYAILRDPKAHVISQYFHCTESKSHASRREYMPDTLNEWLQAWVDALDEEETINEQQKEQKVVVEGENTRNLLGPNRTKLARAKAFRCYDPRNMQSRYVRVNLVEEKASNTEYNAYVGNYSNSHTGRQQQLDTTRALLASKFRVLGIMDRMDQSICAIATEYAGFVPTDCNCTISTSDATSPAMSITGGAPGITANTTATEKRSDHGVQHHGSSYPTTVEEDAMIARLVAGDKMLYDHAVHIADASIQRVEAEHGVSLCPTIRKH